MRSVLPRQNQARVIYHTGFFLGHCPSPRGSFSAHQLTITSLPFTLREPIRV